MAEISIHNSIPWSKVFEQAQMGAASKPTKTETSGSESASSFLQTLQQSLHEVNDMQKTADAATKDFAAGGGTSLHEVMIAMEKADLSLRTITTVRNKVVEAYQEIMRLQV